MSLAHRYPHRCWLYVQVAAFSIPEYGGSLRQGCQRSRGEDRRRTGKDDAPRCVHFGFHGCDVFPRIEVFNVGGPYAQIVAVSAWKIFRFHAGCRSNGCRPLPPPWSPTYCNNSGATGAQPVHAYDSQWSPTSRNNSRATGVQPVHAYHLSPIGAFEIDWWKISLRTEPREAQLDPVSFPPQPEHFCRFLCSL